MDHFFKMGIAERSIVKGWLSAIEAENQEQREFIDIVKEASNTIDYDYSIATLEPSQNKGGKLYYKEGKEVEQALSCEQWETKAKEFAPQYESRLATLFELYLWYAYRCAQKYWTIQYICNESFVSGNNSQLARSGKLEIGGFSDGCTNTNKIVKYGKDFCLCGCCCYENSPSFHITTALVASLEVYKVSTGVVVLKI